MKYSGHTYEFNRKIEELNKTICEYENKINLMNKTIENEKQLLNHQIENEKHKLELVNEKHQSDILRKDLEIMKLQMQIMKL
jgi:hypothetical protein